MKTKLILLGLFISLLGYGQGVNVMRTTSRALSSGSASPTYTIQYQELLDKWTTDPTGDTLTWQNDLTYSLDTADIWDSLDVLHIYATTDNGASEALVNWVTPDSTATAVHAPVWTDIEGYTGDINNDYIDVGYAANDAGLIFSQDACSMGVYIRKDYDQGSNAAGAYITYGVRIVAWYFDNYAYYRANSASTGTIDLSSAATGFFAWNRKGATTTGLFHNGTDYGDDAVVSVAPEANHVYVLGANANGSLNTGTLGQIAVFFMGGALSDTQMTEFNTIIETYMDAIGTGVQ